MPSKQSTPLFAGNLLSEASVLNLKQPPRSIIIFFMSFLEFRVNAIVQRRQKEWKYNFADICLLQFALYDYIAAKLVPNPLHCIHRTKRNQRVDIYHVYVFL